MTQENRIEGVKKILDGHLKPQADYCIDDIARQICGLFPQPLPDEFHRPAVQTFSTAMEHRLRENDHKGGWGISDCTEEYLNDRLVEELGEYFAVKGCLRASQDLDELVDVANFAMMIFQRRLTENDRYHK